MVVNTISIQQGIQNLALIRGKLTNIQELNGKKTEYPINCPHCNELMTPVFRQNRDSQHFRHITGIKHSPESIMHANAKWHLAEKLEKGNKLKIFGKCDSGFCKGFAELPPLLSKKPNKIVVDTLLFGESNYKPDVALLVDGALAGAIEVNHTHKMSREKREWYIANKIAFIEIDVNKDTYESVMSWPEGGSISWCVSDHSEPIKEIGWCANCEKEHAIREQEKARQVKRDKERIERDIKREEFKKNQLLNAEYITKKFLSFINDQNFSFEAKLLCDYCNLSQSINIDITRAKLEFRIKWIKYPFWHFKAFIYSTIDMLPPKLLCTAIFEKNIKLQSINHLPPNLQYLVLKVIENDGDFRIFCAMPHQCK